MTPAEAPAVSPGVRGGMLASRSAKWGLMRASRSPDWGSLLAACSETGGKMLVTCSETGGGLLVSRSGKGGMMLREPAAIAPRPVMRDSFATVAEGGAG